MINYMIGNTWDFTLLDEIERLNDDYSELNVRISEIYGSLSDNPLGTARPDYRIPSMLVKKQKDFIQKAVDKNLIVNYTINIPCFGSLEHLKEVENEFYDFVSRLVDFGVQRFTITHPLIIMLVKRKFPNISIELSTIAHVSSVNQLTLYAQLGVDKICMNLMKNRDFTFLINFREACDKNDIEVELMVNEFCLYECIFRNSCYQLHGHTHTDERSYLYDDYTLGHCTIIKKMQPSEWLKARFIRPEDIGKYVETTGITNFKITGRTFPTFDVIRITEHYMSGNFNGNLLDLWYQLENIGKDREGFVEPMICINNKLLDGFVDFFINVRPNCEIFCGTKCNYCLEYFNKIMKKQWEI